MDVYGRQAALLGALTHPVRLRIAGILAEQEACVCQLQAVLGLRQAHVSQHLMVLRRAGLLQERRHGTFIFYRIGDPGAPQVLRSIRRGAGVEDGLRFPTRQRACSCPQCAGLAAEGAVWGSGCVP